MFDYLLGKQDKPEKKIEADITGIMNVKLKNQFCDLCSKNPATKVAFGKQFKPAFTCANCEIEAVGGSVQRLGPKSLIPIEKFSEELTKELMNYQMSQKTPPVEQKKAGENCEGFRTKVNDISQKITEQFKKMKKTVNTKHQELLEESNKQNIVPIF